MKRCQTSSRNALRVQRWIVSLKVVWGQTQSQRIYVAIPCEQYIQDYLHTYSFKRLRVHMPVKDNCPALCLFFFPPPV